jgi:ferredoxin-NADP reductase
MTVDATERPRAALAGTARPIRVTQVERLVDDVVELELRDPNDEALPDWTPGAHIDLVLPSGRIRSYSLCGRVDDERSYRVAVLREPESRGGSQEIHDASLLGETLGYYGPTNNFKLGEAERYLLLAGGIGITPILPIARALDATGTPYRLVYGGRSRTTMAYLDEVASLRSNDVELVPEDELGRPNFAEILSKVTTGTVVTACGPPGMLAAIGAAWPETLSEAELRVERFAVGDGIDPLQAGLSFGEFYVELTRTGTTVRVPKDRSILSVVWDIVPDVRYSCMHGSCGQCVTHVLAGVPLHRDAWLTREERRANELMMICVDRSSTPLLVLDL